MSPWFWRPSFDFSKQMCYAYSWLATPLLSSCSDEVVPRCVHATTPPVLLASPLQYRIHNKDFWWNDDRSPVKNASVNDRRLMRTLCIHFQLDLVVRSAPRRSGWLILVLIDLRRSDSARAGRSGLPGRRSASASDFHLLKQLLGSRRNLSSRDRAQSVIRLLPNWSKCASVSLGFDTCRPKDGISCCIAPTGD